jgi:hypothetical protein
MSSRSRKITRAIHAHFDRFTRPLLNPIGVECVIDSHLPAYAGGTWKWDTAHARHVIRLSAHLANTNNRGGPLLAYYRTVANHETAHAMFSERDAATIRATGNPYLVNIFEDARIEAAWRSHRHPLTGKRLPRFGWAKFNQFSTVDQGASDPVSILIDYIVCDGSRVLQKEVLTYLATKGIGALGERVLEYYRRIVKCGTLPDLKPIVEDWLAEFGSAPSTSSSPGAHGGTAGAASAGAGVGGTPPPAPSPPPSSGGGGGSAHYIPTPPDREHVKKEHYRPSSDGNAWKKTEDNTRKADGVIHAMNAAFRVGNMTRFTQAPQGRISIRHVVAQLPNIYRKDVKVGDDSPMKIRLIIDTSGSMSSPTAKELGGFIEGLCAMNESGRVKLDMWLSGNGTNSHIENPRREDAHFLYTGGGNEYIHGTMQDSNNWKPARDYDAVIVVTDGQIGDGSVTREHFSGQNNTLCAYVPDGGSISEEILNRMTEQFPHAIYRNDALSLANAVAGTLSSWRAAGMMAPH